jgi:hypothetical protein
MSSLMMALVHRNMEHLTKHHNEVIILMHLLVFCEGIRPIKIVCSIIKQIFPVADMFRMPSHIELSEVY